MKNGCLSALEANARTSLLVPSLIRWFSQCARDLPWRRTRDPYAIWVSEIMLQQTQVKTVVPYFERWMRELPDIRALADARLERLHKLWEGLGYYTRVRNMHKAAQRIREIHGGQFPSDYQAVLALPGIGRYTAGAICSIAFNQPTPILDGNVIRVLTRTFGIDADPKDKQCNQRLWQLAGALVKEASAGVPHANNASVNRCAQLNEALMELGALVCTPRQPECIDCPVAPHCVARCDDRVARLPAFRPRPRITRRQYAAFVVKRGNQILIRQRDADAVNGLLWEFPNIEVRSSRADAGRAAQDLFGVRARVLEPLCTIRHSITRYRITLDVYVAAGLNGAAKRVGGRWVRVSEALQLSFPSAHRRILGRLARD
jgi:A/G-specific adenine glycosylase